MPPIQCPTCTTPIAAVDVNVASNVAFCRACNAAHALSTIAGVDARPEGIDPAVDLTNPPKGTWYRDDGIELCVGASLRSIGGAVGALFIAGFWNGIVSVFVLVAISGTLHVTGISVPHWFPSPVMNGAPMSVGMVIFLWIFLTPFILIGSAMIGAFFACLAGRVEITVRDSQGIAFTGIGPLGWRSRFDAAAVKRVSVQNHRWRDSDGDSQSKQQVVIEADKTVRFGSMLGEDRRRFVASALASALVA